MRGVVLALAVGGWLVHGGSASAFTSQVRDNARLFTPVRKEINREIKEVHHRFRADLVVESFKSVPWSFVPWTRGHKVKQMDEADRAQFFAEWARERVGKIGPKAIYVLVCQEPALTVEVAVGSDPQLQRAFSPAEREQLRELLLAQFRQERYGEGLLAGVAFVRKTLQSNLGDTAVGPPAFDWLEILAVIGAVLAAWLVLECVRAVRWGERGANVVESGIRSYNGGGSFLPGLFATMACGEVRQLFRGGPAEPCPPPTAVADKPEAVADGLDERASGRDPFSEAEAQPPGDEHAPGIQA